MKYELFSGLTLGEFNYHVMAEIAKPHKNKVGQLDALASVIFPCLLSKPASNQEAIARAYLNAYANATGNPDKKPRAYEAWQIAKTDMQAAEQIAQIKRKGGSFDMKVSRITKLVLSCQSAFINDFFFERGFMNKAIQVQPKTVNAIADLLNQDDKHYQQWLGVFCNVFAENQDYFIIDLQKKLESAGHLPLATRIKVDNKSLFKEQSYTKVRPVDGNFTRRNASYREAGVI